MGRKIKDAMRSGCVSSQTVKGGGFCAFRIVLLISVLWGTGCAHTRISQKQLHEHTLASGYSAIPLLPFLGHPHPQVPIATVQILKVIKDPESIDPLIQIARDRTSGRRLEAIESLSVFHDPRVYGLLTETLTNPDVNIRRYTFRAIGALGENSLLDPLLTSVDAEVNRSMQQTVPVNAALEDCVNALASFRATKAGLKLAEILDANNVAARDASARTLGKFSEDHDVMVAVTRFLQRRRDVRESPYDVQWNLIAAIERHPIFPETGNAILYLLGSNDNAIRNKAAQALNAGVIDQTHIPQLVKILTERKAEGGPVLEAIHLRNLMGAAGKLGSHDAARVLVSYLKSTDKDVAASAANALITCVDVSMTAEIIDVWRSTSNGGVKWYLEKSLASGSYPVTYDETNKQFTLNERRLKDILDQNR